MIRIENISAGYGPCNVLNNLNLQTNAGELIVLLGPNGCGKSTLLKTISGLIPHREGGTIWINNQSLSSMPLKLRARQIAYLAQSRQAQADMLVKDVIELGRAPFRGRLGRISADGRQAIEKAVAKTELSSFLDRKFGQLSGGEQARVLLARALCMNASVLLADEPIAALDPYYQISMMEILKAEAKSGKTVITALHDLPLAAQYADRVWIMNKGQIIADGAPKTAMSEQIISDVFKIRMNYNFLNSVVTT